MRCLGRLLAVILILGLVVAGAVGCGSAKPKVKSEPQDAFVSTQEFRFAPMELRLEVNRPVKLKLVNRGSTEHEFEAEVNKGKTKVEKRIKPGETAIVEFTPTEKERTTFWCAVKGHREKGMMGSIVVEGSAE